MEVTEIPAELVVDGDSYYIKINAEPSISIPISEDKANAVKAAFCELLQLLRRGPCKILFPDTGNDLFCSVAREYLRQLNIELAEVYEEMEEHGFIADKEGGDDKNCPPPPSARSGV